MANETIREMSNRHRKEQESSGKLIQDAKSDLARKTREHDEMKFKFNDIKSELTKAQEELNTKTREYNNLKQIQDG